MNVFDRSAHARMAALGRRVETPSRRLSGAGPDLPGLRSPASLALALLSLLMVVPSTAVAQELMGTRIVESGELRVASGPEGTIRTYFDAPTSTLLNLGLRSTTLEPGESPHPTRPHTRATESLLLVEAGTLQVRLGEEIQQVKAGAAVLLGPNQWHELLNAGDLPVTFYEIAWTSPGMNGEPDYPERAVNWRRPRQ